MDCEKLKALLDAYMDGELSADDALALEAHAKSCASCARELEAANLLKDLLNDMRDEEVAVPLQAQAAWRSAIRAEAKRRKMRMWTRIAGVAAAAIVLVFGSTLLLNPEKDTALTQEPSLYSMPMENGGLIARDGDKNESIEATNSAQDVDYSVWKKIASNDMESSISTLENLAEEYSGSCTRTTKDLCCVQLPYANMDDFLNAIKGIGTELDSEIVEKEVETAVIYIQFSAE